MTLLLSGSVGSAGQYGFSPSASPLKIQLLPQSVEIAATVAAVSLDWGKSWMFEGEALGLNPYCPADPTDPDNNNVIVDRFSTPYGSNSSNAADNGLGHAFVMTIDGVQLIYHLNRANGHIDSDPSSCTR